MGKNKNQKGNKQQKKDKTFSVVKPKKGKTKTVSSNLKKMNLQNKSKTEKIDKSFAAVQTAVLETSKMSTEKPKVFQKGKYKKCDAPVDMDTAADAFAKL